jgi:hypothetical protein
MGDIVFIDPNQTPEEGSGGDTEDPIKKVIAVMRKESLDALKNAVKASEQNMVRGEEFARGVCLGLERAICLVKWAAGYYEDDLDDLDAHEVNRKKVMGKNFVYNRGEIRDKRRV